MLANGGSNFWGTSSDIIVTIGGVLGFIIVIVSIVMYFKRGIGYLNTLKSAINKWGDFIDRVDEILNKGIPSLFEELEDKGSVEKGFSANYLKVILKGYTENKSPRQLNKAGCELLNVSGMKKIIDDNLDGFISELEDKKFENYLDLENGCIYFLRDKEDSRITNALKNFLFNNPQYSLDAILLVGGIYLRNKYTKKNPDLPDPSLDKDK